MRQKLLFFLAGVVVGLPWIPGMARIASQVPAVATHTGLPVTLTRESGIAAYAGYSELAQESPLAGVMPSVVRVTGRAFAGSGVIIEPSGLVLTSAHIIGDATQVGVTVGDSKLLTGAVERVDAQRDLALLRLPPGSYPAAVISSDSTPSLGSRITIIGYPLGLPGTASVTTGIVSRVLDEPELGRTMIQTDAAINLGSSGGPMLDQQGAVVGIVASILGDYQSITARGISFAVSAETIRREFLAMPGR
ncbi:MAG: trypsin-like peptidase domain-containing protein [SAR202 cluster bacterium]|nr:trypsin-like peptidase domain-containing protein [SAR202 cluster bacterium]